MQNFSLNYGEKIDGLQVSDDDLFDITIHDASVEEDDAAAMADGDGGNQEFDVPQYMLQSVVVPSTNEEEAQSNQITLAEDEGIKIDDHEHLQIVLEELRALQVSDEEAALVEEPALSKAMSMQTSILARKSSVLVRQGDEDEAPAANTITANEEDDDGLAVQLRIEKIEKMHIPWGHKRTEAAGLVVMEVRDNMDTFLRTNMNRMHMLNECLSPISAHLTTHGVDALSATLRIQDLHILQRVHEATLLARTGAIVVNLFPVRAVITAYKAFIVLPDGADGWLEPFLTSLKEPEVHVNSQEGGLPFEFKLLEGLLVGLVNHYEDMVARCLDGAAALLAACKSGTIGSSLNMMIRIKAECNDTCDSLTRIQQALEKAQEDVAQLSLMYLSAMKESPSTYTKLLRKQQGNTQQADTMIDTFVLEVKAMARDMQLTLTDLDNIETLLVFQLDVTRNSLILVDVLCAVINAWVGAATLIAALGGMNVYGGVDDLRKWMEYVTVSGGSVVVGTLASFALLWAVNILRL